MFRASVGCFVFFFSSDVTAIAFSTCSLRLASQGSIKNAVGCDNVVLMATEDNTEPEHKRAKIEHLWQQVLINPEFKRRCILYSLEQLARHSQLLSIQSYCSHHCAHIPSSEEEEEKAADGSEAVVSQASECDTEHVARQRTCLEEHRPFRSTPDEHPVVAEHTSPSELKRDQHAIGSYCTGPHSRSSSSRPEATSSQPRPKQDKKITRVGAIGGKRGQTMTTRAQGAKAKPAALANAPWRHKKS